MRSTTPVTTACERRRVAAEQVALELAADAALDGQGLDNHQLAALRILAPFALASAATLDAALTAAGPQCTDLDPEELFLPGDDLDNNPPIPQVRIAEREHAAELCAGCPARAQCLALSFALPLPGRHGVWGGLTARDRAALRALWPDLCRRLAALAAADDGDDGAHLVDEVA